MRARPSEARHRSLPRDRARAFGFALIAAFALGSMAPGSVPVARAAPSTYTGEAPVASQSDEDRLDALKIALANVVIEQTGDSGAVSRPDVAAAIAKADRYVLQFRYKQNPGAAGSGTPALTLVAEFDAAAVDQMLQRLGLGADVATGGTAPIQSTPSEATVWIGGIRSAEDYARVIGYLGKSNLVKSSQPTEARGDGMLVRLSLATDLKHFLDAVAIEHTLSVVNGSPPVDGVDATLALGP